MKIKISDIKINEGRRSVDYDIVVRLVNSIGEVGLINPITVDVDNVLVAGLHRLEAHKIIGTEYIEANITDKDDIIKQLIEIDENLIRNEIHFIDEGDLLLTRKEIYLLLHPKTGHGGDRKSEEIKSPNWSLDHTSSFVDDTVEKTGKGSSTVKRSVRRSERIIPAAKELIKRKDMTRTQADMVAGLDEDQQNNIVAAAKDVDRDSVDKIIREIKGADTLVTKFTGDEESYTPATYVEMARLVMGSITTDPASNELAQKTVMADTYYTKEQDGLSKSWEGNIFLNPPYSHGIIDKFVSKLVEELDETKQAILLTNNNTDTKWFVEAATNCTLMCFTTGRISFYKESGIKTSPVNGQTFFYFGNNADLFRDAFRASGLIMEVKQ